MKRKYLLTIPIVLSAAALSACSIQIADPSQNTIKVSASSEMKAVPDSAELSFAVISEGTEPEKIQQENAEKVNKITEALKSSGVQAESIKTDYSELRQKYEYELHTSDNTEDHPNEYKMSTGLTVSDIAISDVGKMMTDLAQNGATEMGDVRTYSKEYDELYQKALSEAMTEAKGKAESLAKDAGVSISKAVSVEEGYQDKSSKYISARNYAMETAADGAAAPTANMNFEPGEIDISASVTVEYGIQ